jgi:4-alpha-glucanotransferase
MRVDHVMGLFRLFWVPGGAPAREGAYVRYPADDLLAIVALESHRAGAVVVGEDLGTVEESARDALATHDVLSYRLLWFEDGPPSTWPATSMAAVTTHDLPTVAGLWSGDDLAAQRRAGLDPNEEGTEEMRARLVRAAGLGDGATIDDAVLGAHRALAESPAVLLCATLDDALAEPERPNVPGADGARPNWSLALPATVEELPSIERATRIAQVLGRAVAAGGGEAEAKTDPAPEALDHDRGSRTAGRGSSR